MRRKVLPQGRIEKPEDKAWLRWFEKLDEKEHENFLKQAGLSEEDIEEWKQWSKKDGNLDELLEKIEEELVTEERPKRGKK
ncbi:MAG: hypothetical protein J7L14_03430 [Candidatus Diapherotrites archaeon]|nr:hypothetical protein [Candidatus Diapherotrites archaeon]